MSSIRDRRRSASGTRARARPFASAAARRRAQGGAVVVFVVVAVVRVLLRDDAATLDGLVELVHLGVEVGELLIAMPYRGATRHLQLTVQLVGHEEKYMKSVENDVPAIRNGLLIFFNQQEFGRVSTYEGRESLRRDTLQRVNEIIGATAENRVADVYFTAYITQ